MLRGDKSVKYQNEKIQYHDIMVGYYQDMKKDPDARLQEDEIKEQISYHVRLGVYHQKRRALILKHEA